jgi:TatD DNase family protein
MLQTDKISNYTVGLHPWDIDEKSYKEQLEIVKNYLFLPNCKGVGETGFDRLRNFNEAIQLEVFNQHISFANEFKKEVVVCHIVRGYDLLLKCIKNTSYRGKFLIHDYSGNAQITSELLKDERVYLSLGATLFRDNSKVVEHLDQIPQNRLFFETDDSSRSIEEVYDKYFQLSEVTDKEKNNLIEDFYQKFLKFLA